MNTRPHRREATQSYAMSRRLHYKNPGQAILRVVRRRLLALPWVSGTLTAEQESIADAVMLVDICISRVNANLEA